MELKSLSYKVWIYPLSKLLGGEKTACETTSIFFLFHNIKAAQSVVILRVIIQSFSKGHENLQPSSMSLPAI